MGHADAQTLTAYKGHIIASFASYAGNESFRVTLDTPMPTCYGNWGYVNTDNSNYQVYVSTLTSAYLAGQTVTLVTTPDVNGFCQIIELGTQK